MENKTPELERKFYPVQWWNEHVEMRTGGINSGEDFEYYLENDFSVIREMSTGKLWRWDLATNPKDKTLGVICSLYSPDN